MRWKSCCSLILAMLAVALSPCLSLRAAAAWAAPEETPQEVAPPKAAPAVVSDDEPAALEETPVAATDDAAPGSIGDDIPPDEPAPVTAPPTDPYAEQTVPSSDAPAQPSGPPAESSPQPAPVESPPAPLQQSPKPAELIPAKRPQPAAPRAPLDPATLDGVHPGTTTRAELHELWGKPEHSQRIAGGARETYRLEKLGKVRATIIQDVVTSLAVHIDRPVPFGAISKRLAVDNVESVDIYDDRGDLLGAAYPERGVLLGYVPQSQPPKIFQVVVESIDAQPFVARAEVRLQGRYAESLADVEQALALAPDHPQAHHLRGELMLKRGELDEALMSAQRAAELEPQVPAHRLLIAHVLAAAGDYPQAIARVRDLLDEPNLADLDAAQAACQWGDYLAHSHLRDYTAAIKHHQRAIQLAEALLGDPERSTRRAAKELLLDAHLGVAYDIGRGRWQQKTATVAKWIDRAAVLADDLMRTEQAGAEVRLRVYLGALTAIAGNSEPPDVTKWVAGTRQLGQKLYEKSQDPTYRRLLAWQLGCAMSEVVEIDTARGLSDDAFAAGSLARSLLEEAEPVAGKLPTYNYQRGLLFYRMGVTYALERTDHAQAVVWFDRAAPLLESPVPAAAVDAGTQGETFVSMAVSYWEQQNRPEALRLTNQGLKLMEQAVEDGALEAAALAVPYGNLAAMHNELGDQEQAKWCADLASRYEASTKQ